MIKKNNIKLSTAFSLMELLVVIFILSLIAGLIFSTIRSQTKNKVLKIESLKKNLLSEIQSSDFTQFFCIDKFKKCFFLQNGQVMKYSGSFKIGKNVKIYTMDKRNSLELIEDFGVFKSSKVSFRYNIFPNKSTSQMIIKNDDGVFYMPSYFGKVKKVDSLEDAKSLWIKYEYDLQDSTSYY